MSNTTVPRSELSAWIEKVQNPDTKQYINDRVKDQMDYYKIKSREYKKKYNSWMTTSIVISLMIPVFSIFANESLFMKAIISFLGGGTAAITAYLRLHIRSSRGLSSDRGSGKRRSRDRSGRRRGHTSRDKDSRRRYP